MDNKRLCSLKQNGIFSENGNVYLTSDFFSGKAYLKNCTEKTRHFYFYYDNKIWDMEDKSQIMSLQNLLLEKRDYKTAKTFNEFLCDVTHLNKHIEWLYYPIELQIEHTNRCNARCIMCGHFNADKSKCSDVSKDVFRKLEFILPFCRYVGLHGYGEPFLTSGLIDFFELYKNYGVRLYTNTNMSYMPEKYLPYIRDLFDEINVSCECVDKQKYEFIRKGLSFDFFTKNIEKIHNNCPNVRLNLFVVLMRQNITDIPDIIHFAHEHHFSSVVFTHMIAMDSNDNYMDTPQMFPNMTSYYLKKGLDIAEKLGIKVSYPAESLLENESVADEMKLYQSRSLYEYSAGELNVDGNVLFSRKKISVSEVVGNNHSCNGICDVFAEQMYCSLDGQLAACCVDGYHYTETADNLTTIESYWKSGSVKLLRSCFEAGKVPLICNNCNYILLNRLKKLSLSDRNKYSSDVNSR